MCLVGDLERLMSGPVSRKVRHLHNWSYNSSASIAVFPKATVIDVHSDCAQLCGTGHFHISASAE